MQVKRSRFLVAVLLWISACAPAGGAHSRRSSQRDDYLDRAQAQLNQLDQRVTDLKAQADRAQGKTKAALNAEIDQLRRKQAAAQQRLAQVQAASEASWQSLQAGTDAALNDLKNAYNQAAARFNQAQ